MRLSSVLCLGIALSAALVALPAAAQMSGMGGGSAKPTQPGAPSVRATPSPGVNTNGMGGTTGMSPSGLPPATRPLGIAGLGVQSGMSGMTGINSGLPGQASMGSMNGPSASMSGGSAMSGSSRSAVTERQSPATGIGQERAASRSEAVGSGIGSPAVPGSTTPPTGSRFSRPPTSGTSAGMSGMSGPR